jgi:K+-sensing histidine kinase KdpD
VGTREWSSGRARLLGVAVVAPLLVCLILLPLRDRFASTNEALVLVLVLVAVATAGDRLAGVLAACSAGLWFDFFLTQPYQRFRIAESADVQTTLLLLGVGVAVTEIARWGRRQQATAGRRAGYLEGLEATAEAAAAGSSSTSALIDTVAGQIASVLRLARCRFDYGTGLGHPQLAADGRVRRGDQTWDVDTAGLPSDADTELVVESGGLFMGRFLLTPGPDTRPSRAELQVAFALANQVGAALRAHSDTRWRD